MGLLNDAFSAAGGLKRWNQIRRFSCHISITGALISERYGPGALKDIVVEGDAHEQLVRVIGLETYERAIFRPDWVGIEDETGGIILERADPRERFERHGLVTPWDILDLVYYCGYSTWNYMTAPFFLEKEGVSAEELRSSPDSDRLLRGLRVEFPKSFVTHCQQQTFYFDPTGLLVQLDYNAAELGGAAVSQTVGAHQEFSGVVIPTLRRCRLVDPGRAAPVPSVDIEIFDATFQ